MQPLQHSYGASAIVTAIAADTAARLLATRFATLKSRGTQELVAEVAASVVDTRRHSENLGSGGGAASSTVVNTEDDDRGGGEESGSKKEFPEPLKKGVHQGMAAAFDMDEVAAVLASIPERAAATKLPALRPPAFIALLVEHLLESHACVDSSQKGRIHSSPTSAVHSAANTNDGRDSRPVAHDPQSEFWTDSDIPSGSRAAGATCQPQDAKDRIQQQGGAAGQAFVGLVLSKLARRGHARIVAHALWRSMRQYVVLPPRTSGVSASGLRGGGTNGTHPHLWCAVHLRVWGRCLCTGGGPGSFREADRGPLIRNGSSKGG